jgi:hypothetical protein
MATGVQDSVGEISSRTISRFEDVSYSETFAAVAHHVAAASTGDSNSAALSHSVTDARSD